MDETDLSTIIDYFNQINSDPLCITKNGWNFTYMRACGIDILNDGYFVFKWCFSANTFERIKTELLEKGHQDFIHLDRDVICFKLGEYNIEIEKNFGFQTLLEKKEM